MRSARELLGPEATDADAGLGYASRSLRHIAAGLLQLTGPNVSSVERADAKQQFSKALKIAHSRMHNHQVVSQLLMLMAPLQVGVDRVVLCVIPGGRCGKQGKSKPVKRYKMPWHTDRHTVCVGLAGWLGGWVGEWLNLRGRRCCKHSVSSPQMTCDTERPMQACWHA